MPVVIGGNGSVDVLASSAVHGEQQTRGIQPVEADALGREDAHQRGEQADPPVVVPRSEQPFHAQFGTAGLSECATEALPRAMRGGPAQRQAPGDRRPCLDLVVARQLDVQVAQPKSIEGE